MRLDDLKYEFPKMPEEMKEMIEREVEKQVKTEYPQFKKRKKLAGRTIAASVAAVMILGTTVYAGVRAYRLSQKPVGKYGVEVKISKEDSGKDDLNAPMDIPNVKLNVGYLPERMVKTEEGKYSYEDNLYKGGISILLYKMDTGDETFEMQQEDVSLSEDFTVNGYEGVYLESPDLYEAETSFHKRIYVAYTDLHYVMEMYAASDVSKEEAVKIAEGIQLVKTDEKENEAVVSACSWSEYQEQKALDSENEPEDFAVQSTVAEEKMENTHTVGESFLAAQEGLSLKVKEVQVSDDISLLNSEFVDEELRGQTDENGRLLPADIQYIKEGSTESLSEVVKSRQVPQKLVYVTVEYTNTGDTELSDVLFTGNIVKIEEDGSQVKMYDGKKYASASGWDYREIVGAAHMEEMWYYDVHGGERGNNYISHLKPNETATVHMAWLVPEEELGIWKLF